MKIIINADDFGFKESISDAILEALRRRLVTQTTLMVNMPDAYRAVAEAKKAGFSSKIGLHLTLTEGVPLTDNIRRYPAICNEAGEFYIGNGLMDESLNITPEIAVAISKEVDAQIEKFLSYGLTMRHCDGHHHIHMRPRIAKLVLPLLKKHEFNSVRRPSVAPHSPRAIGRWIANFSFLAKAQICRLKCVDGFTGWSPRRKFGVAQVGCLEIMVHPRYSQEGKLIDDIVFFPPDGPELDGIRDWISAVEYELATYADI